MECHACLYVYKISVSSASGIGVVTGKTGDDCYVDIGDGISGMGYRVWGGYLATG